MNIVSLLSGGLDSAVMATILKEEGFIQYPLYINYGHHAYKMEIQSAHNICNDLELNKLAVLDVPDYGRLIPSGLTDTKYDIVNDAFLPGRNGLFLLVAASFAYSISADGISIGLLSDEYSIFPDQNSLFIKNASNFINNMLGTDMIILCPLMNFSKADVISFASNIGLDGTYSCHLGNTEPCGKCISCLEFRQREV